ncbi:MAG: hypothetical protein LC793_20940 [Thermomicrobia bacterium]|nr:hypothetical protein [Thermomicrobia bacterium]MCA1724237.1 hypothetical protein [Thermomicrobia bacterium]
MSEFKHEAVIATIWANDIETVVEFREQMPEQYREFLVGPIGRTIDPASFALMPDGRKEDRPVSIEMDEVREDFIVLLRTLEADWAHVVLYDETNEDREEVRRPFIAASSEWVFNGSYYERGKGNRPS